MATFFLAPRAREDAMAIVQYIARDDSIAADRWIDRFDEKCELVAEQPGIGEQRPELGVDIQSTLVGRYIIYYRTITDGIEVIRVIVGDRDTRYL